MENKEIENWKKKFVKRLKEEMGTKKAHCCKSCRNQIIDRIAKENH